MKVRAISFRVYQHEFARRFHVLRDFRAADMVLGSPWLNDDQATLTFGTERLIITLMDGNVIKNQVIKRRTKCLLLSSTKVQKLMRKSARAKGRTANKFTVDGC
jgi:hypothetical protein